MALGALIMWLLSGKLEKDLARLRDETERLQRDIEEKEKIDAMRRDFLTGVSHELKTPLALICGYAEGLRDNVNEDAESRTYYSEVILDEAERMNRLVRQITDLHELEFGKDTLSIETFELTALIQGVIEALGTVVKEAQATITFEPAGPCPVRGDPFRIEEVVTNYLTNAIHHVNGERRIEVSLEDRGERVAVHVYNDGEPIPEEDHERIWEKFYKVDKARSRAYGGSGIGLSVVKAILDAHGESYGAENVAGGVVFTFTLTKSSEI